jgi:hypothetical protein
LQTFGVDVVERVVAPFGATRPEVPRSCVTDVVDPALAAAAFAVVVPGVVAAPGGVDAAGTAGATGVTEFDALDALPVPCAFVAVTVNV